MATVAELLAQRNFLEAELARYQSILEQFQSRNTRALTGAINAAKKNIATVEAKLAQNETELRAARAAERQGENAGEDVANAQQARDNQANTQDPEAAPSVQNPDGRVSPELAQTPSNSIKYNGARNEDSGIEGPVRKNNNIQTVPPPTAQPSVNGSNDIDSGLSGIIPGSGVGISAGGDDSAATRGRITTLFTSGANSKIIPQENALAKYASYTYNVSIYIMSPDDYRRIVTNKKMGIPGSQLLIQSGGMPFTSATPTASAEGGLPNRATNSPTVTGQNTSDTRSSQSGRNQYFPLDYYIDNVKFTSLQPGKGTNSPQNINNLSFKLIEPNGINFLDNLYSACEQYVGKKENYASQNYLMVIRFYGYDQNGNLVKATNSREPNGVTDKTALIEKFIPFQFTGIKFKVANNLTEYNCECVVPANNIASGQARGTIPYNTEIQAATLSELFGGAASFTVNQPATSATNGRETQSTNQPSGIAPGAPPKGNAAPQKTVTSGLVDALNQYQQELVQNETYEIPDTYKVEFLDSVIANAKTVPPENYDLKKTGNTPPATANQKLNPVVGAVQTNTQTKPSVAGTSLVQFIDQAIRSSTYIYNQQTRIPTVDDNGKPTSVPNGTPAQVVAWYRIGFQALPKGYDKKRKDYAYDITYTIAPYLVNDLKSDYFPQTKFRGTHKKYSYWYTGENNEVLSYEQDFNYLYYVVINGNSPPAGVNDLDYRDEAKRSFQTRSNQSDQGQSGKTNEPAANAADLLYSPSDLSRVRLSIVGDPGWIAQGDVWRGVDPSILTAGPFFPDGTINTDIEEPLFEIAWNKPVDYDLTTGLMNPNQRKAGANEIETLGPGPTQSYIYRAVSVTSNFTQGKFTQDLEGVLINFPQTSIKTNQVPAPGKDVEVDVPPDNQIEKAPTVGIATNRQPTAKQAGFQQNYLFNKNAAVSPPVTNNRYNRRSTANTSPTNQGVKNTTTGILRGAPAPATNAPVPATTTTTPGRNQNGAVER